MHRWDSLVEDQGENYRFHCGLQIAYLELDLETSKVNLYTYMCLYICFWCKDIYMIYIYIYIHIYIHIYIYIYIHICIYISIYIYTFTGNVFIKTPRVTIHSPKPHQYAKGIYVCIYICIYLCKYIYLCIYIYIYIYIHIYIFVYIHINICIYIYIGCINANV
jgi:hypothetical protein